MRPPNRVPLHVRLMQLVGRVVGAVGAAWEFVIWPVERFFATLFGRTLAASEQLENVDSVFVLVGRVLWAPFRFVGWIGSKLLPSSLRSLIVGGWDGLGYLVHCAVEGIFHAAEFFNLDIVIHWLMWLTWPVWRPIAAVLGFVYAWIVTRDARPFLMGLPALVLLAPFAVVGYLATTNNHVTSIPAYRKALEAATTAGDFELVQLYEGKLAQLGVSTQLNNYRTAVRLASDGKWDEAYARMQELAPADGPGYPQAHFWIVQQLLSRQIDVPEGKRGILMDTHVKQLESLGIESPMLTLVRATRLAAQERPADASELLSPLAVEIPAAAFEKLRLDLATRNTDALRGDADTVVRHLETHVRDGMELSAGHYRLWVAALEILQRPDELESTISAWATAYPGDLNAQRGLVRLLTARFERLVDDPSSSPEELARLLCRIGERAPPSGWLLQQMARLYDLRDNAIVPNHIPEKTIAALLADEETPAIVLEALGAQAAQVSEYPRALMCFERLTQLAPHHAVGWNNCAWVLCQLDDGRLEEALTAVNQALEILPGEHRFRETRGQILVKLARWPDAIADLEFAINGMSEAREVHASLAIAYDAVGDAELAEVHRSRAN